MHLLEPVATNSMGEWPYLVILERLALAVALGTFIGMERERRHKDAGVRTFALICLLGALGGVLGTAYSLAALGLLAVIILISSVHAQLERRDFELTTSVTMCVVAFIGILCGLGHTLTPTAVGITVAAVLASKQPLVTFTLGLTEQEIRSAILLGILALVIYPALPEGAIDRWDLIDLRSAWVTVILIASIGFANYILLKRYGSRGIELTGFLGGLVSTKVTTAELSKRCRESNGALSDETYRGVLLSRASMVARNGFILALLSFASFEYAIVSLVLMFFGSTWFVLFDRRLSRSTDDSFELGIRSPFSLRSVFKFGAIFLVLQVTGVLAQRGFGSFGFFVVTVLGGVVSSASAVSSAATLAANGHVSALSAGLAAVAANIVSSIVDVVLVARITSNRRLTWRLAIGTTIICLLGVIGGVMSARLLG